MKTAFDANVDLEHERHVLGQVLQFGLVQPFEDAGLKAEHFSRQEHALIWQAAQAVAEAGGTADLVTVRQQLMVDGHMDRIGPAYFSSLVDGVVRPTAPNVLLEVARLEEMAVGRLAHYAALQLNKALEAPGAVADGVVAKHLDAVQQILDRKQSTAKLWFDVNDQLRVHERDVQAGEDGARIGLGLDALDAVIGGMRPGEVFGLLGRPGIGKTVVLSHLTKHVALAGFGQIFYSLEMPASQIVGRLKQIVYRVGRQQLERMTSQGLIDEGLYRRTFDQLVLVDSPSLSVGEMHRRARQIQLGPLKDMPLGVIVIDHLGLIGGDRKLSTYDRISAQAREIKELAKSLRCVVVLAIQVSREAGGDGSRELGLGSARDSGVVEEAMDYMVGIRRLDRALTLSTFERDRFRDVIFMKVIKNRHESPSTREVAYRFSGAGLRLDEDHDLTVEGENVADKIAAATSKGGRR